jgi:predicted O-linked N-acetylglucosamine transferase (SPINDLY family)
MFNWVKNILPASEKTAPAAAGVVRSTDAAQHKSRGDDYLNQSDWGQAEACYRQAIAAAPNLVDAYVNLGFVLQVQARYAEAEFVLEQALELDAKAVDALYILGVIARAESDIDHAIEFFNKAIEIKPDFEAAYSDLYEVLLQNGQVARARKIIATGVERNPDSAALLLNMGNIRASEGASDAAVDYFSRAVAIRPDYVEAHTNLGLALEIQGKLGLAYESLEKARVLRPDGADMLFNLGHVLHTQGVLDGAIERYRQALQLQPDFTLAHSGLLYVMSSYQKSSPAEYAAQARRFGQSVMKHAKPYREWTALEQVLAAPAGAKPLRVGIVSGDMNTHPVAFFLGSVLPHLNPARITLVAYPTREYEDQMTARLKPFFSEWVPIPNLSDEAAARRIHDDGIHILIDLAGHTAHNRLPVFAWKPAPVQASWLGYWASTGVPGIDYLIGDQLPLSDGQREHFSEAVWPMPDTRFCFTPPAARDALPVTPPAVLTNGYVTFGNYQTVAKIDDAVLAAWARIFDAVPTARLRLQSRQLNEAAARDEMERRLALAGIAAARVTLVGSVSREDYLAQHAEVDIILDTFPFPGGTTTCEALWMGVPTLTLTGETIVSRQGHSLLACAGLQDWVAMDKDEYVAKAIEHASDPERLARLRVKLRDQVLTSPLYDAARFARNLEDALHGMWEKRKHVQSN